MNTTMTATTPLLKRVFGYVAPFWTILLLGILGNGLFSGIDALFTYAIKPFMNKGFVDRDLSFIRWIPWLIFVGIVLRGVMNAVGSYCMTWVARSVVKRFREDIFSHILRLPASYFDQTSTGPLLSKLLYDAEQISQISADALSTYIQSFCLVMGMLTVMFVISWQLSCAFLIVVPFIAVLVRYSNRRIRRVSHAVQHSMGEVTEIAEEAIEGYRVVRIFGGEQYESDKFQRALKASRHSDLKVAVTRALNVLGVQCMIAIGIAAMMFLAIALASSIEITPGGFISIVAAMLMLIKPMKNLTTIGSIIQSGLAGAESIFRLLDTELERDVGTVTLEKAQGNLEFHEVSLSYASSQEPVLKNVSLSIRAGEHVALVGRSGSGKSSLVSLIPRFYEPTSGYITLDGHRLDSLTLASLRKQIAVVSQQVTLFNDTIAKNIAYGLDESVSEARIIEAAKAAHAWEFISQFPNGLQTLVGENGVLLSGGQRQRIAIARAILKNAPILILDEATSALDTESERLIQSALENVMKSRTTLVIAHRLSTIEQATRIIVLQDGQIIEQGNHRELLEKSGLYSNLYHLQFSQQAEEALT